MIFYFVKKLFHFLARKGFRHFERLFGLHVTPAHYYSPIPITSDLKPDDFEKISEGVGIDWNETQQLGFLKTTCSRRAAEFVPQRNSGLSLADAYILHTMLREKAPRLMVEIGAGDTTKISLNALDLNRREGKPFKFHSIEPYPRPDLLRISDPDFELTPLKVQEVDIELISSADLLFIDSSHVSKIGSDVNFEILEIVPRMKVGSVIHWHDIVLPANYWKEWIEDGNMFWNESYMVHSFMLFNESFRILWASRFMSLKHITEMKTVFPYLRDEHRLTSFWVERVK